MKKFKIVALILSVFFMAVSSSVFAMEGKRKTENLNKIVEEKKEDITQIESEEQSFANKEDDIEENLNINKIIEKKNKKQYKNSKRSRDQEEFKEEDGLDLKKLEENKQTKNKDQDAIHKIVEEKEENSNMNKRIAEKELQELNTNKIIEKENIEDSFNKTIEETDSNVINPEETTQIIQQIVFSFKVNSEEFKDYHIEGRKDGSRGSFNHEVVHDFISIVMEKFREKFFNDIHNVKIVAAKHSIHLVFEVLVSVPLKALENFNKDFYEGLNKKLDNPIGLYEKGEWEKFIFDNVYHEGAYLKDDILDIYNVSDSNINLPNINFIRQLIDIIDNLNLELCKERKLKKDFQFSGYDVKSKTGDGCYVMTMNGMNKIQVHFKLLNEDRKKMGRDNIRILYYAETYSSNFLFTNYIDRSCGVKYSLYNSNLDRFHSIFDYDDTKIFKYNLHINYAKNSKRRKNLTFKEKGVEVIFSGDDRDLVFYFTILFYMSMLDVVLKEPFRVVPSEEDFRIFGESDLQCYCTQNPGDSLDDEWQEKNGKDFLYFCRFDYISGIFQSLYSNNKLQKNDSYITGEKYAPSKIENFKDITKTKEEIAKYDFDLSKFKLYVMETLFELIDSLREPYKEDGINSGYSFFKEAVNTYKRVKQDNCDLKGPSEVSLEIYKKLQDYVKRNKIKINVNTYVPYSSLRGACFLERYEKHKECMTNLLKNKENIDRDRKQRIFMFNINKKKQEDEIKQFLQKLVNRIFFKIDYIDNVDFVYDMPKSILSIQIFSGREKYDELLKCIKETEAFEEYLT